MFETVNVAVGAVLGVVLAASQAFKPERFSDLLQPLIFVVLIGFIAVNIHAARDSLARARAAEPESRAKEVHVRYFILSIVMFAFMEIVIIVIYTPLLSEGIYQDFKNVSYAWIFVIITILWYSFAIATTFFDRG